MLADERRSLKERRSFQTKQIQSIYMETAGAILVISSLVLYIAAAIYFRKKNKNKKNINRPPYSNTPEPSPPIKENLQQVNLDLSPAEFAANMNKVRASFPFDYWHETLYEEHGMLQYTFEICKEAEQIMNTLIKDLIALGLKADTDLKLEKFKTAVLAYNQLARENEGLIETGEREDLCEVIDQIGINCGLDPDQYGEGDGIASEWREW